MSEASEIDLDDRLAPPVKAGPAAAWTTADLFRAAARDPLVRAVVKFLEHGAYPSFEAMLLALCGELHGQKEAYFKEMVGAVRERPKTFAVVKAPPGPVGGGPELASPAAEVAPNGEAACRPGGSHGLCGTHPTCEMVRRTLGSIRRSIGRLADGVTSVVLPNGEITRPRRNVVDGEALSEVLAFADLNQRG